MQTKIRTVDGETLMSRPLVPIPFIVQSLIPGGLHILAGAPKIGKSWLALWLCLQVAKGETVWNFTTEQKTALYLCLEDSEARIQNRLLDITDDAPANVHFAITAGSIGDGLEEQLEHFVAGHPDTGLIVIDTLQRVRRMPSDNAYAGDYRDLGALKRVADRLGVAILLVHHLRKLKDDDPMNRVSGTTGITGAADASFVLEKDARGSDRATLYCAGRDIEYRELQLRFERETRLWTLVADSVENPEQLLGDTVALLCAYLKIVQHFTGTPSELAEQLQPHSKERIIPSALSKRLLENRNELFALGIRHTARRSNSRRIIELTLDGDARDGSDGSLAPPPHHETAVAADPATFDARSRVENGTG